VKRSDAAEYVLTTADEFLAGMDRHAMDDAEQTARMLRVIEGASLEVRALMHAIAEGPDDPDALQGALIIKQHAAYVKIAAAAMAVLVISPITKEVLGPLAVISGPIH